MVVSGGAGGTSQVNLGRYLAVGQDKTEGR